MKGIGKMNKALATTKAIPNKGESDKLKESTSNKN